MDVRRLLKLEEDLDFAVEAGEAGRRLDHLVAAKAFWVSRAAVQRWIREGRAQVDGQIEKRPGRACSTGQRIRCRAPKTPRDLCGSIDDLLDLPVVHRGEGWMVVVKPSGLQTHPGGGVIKRTLLTVLAVRFEQASEPKGPWLPHRLDRETSGLSIVTLRKDVQSRFVVAFEAHRIRRQYRARVRGSPGVQGESFVLEFPLQLVSTKPMRVEVRDSGVQAATVITIRRSGSDVSDLDVEPVTGRQHQIRVHLAHAGHPIVGDPLYDPKATPGDRLHLHARGLVIPSDVAGTKDPVVVESDCFFYDP
jgi:23S rRNA pseudouridine1911/1915/1917 synthase